MHQLIREICVLKGSDIRRLVESRAKDFQDVHRKDSKEWFSEMCFCILTANSTAKKGIEIQECLGYKGFVSLSLNDLTKFLKAKGHRFYNMRAKFIVEARKHTGIKDVIMRFEDERDARDWLAENVLGLGYKEASHFLRNVGFKNVAILDRHIINLLFEHGIIKERPKTLTRKRYLEIEGVMDKIAKKAGLNHAELDLYMWYKKTGDILK
jgi:N-glycosylase/DNA lyase